MAMDAVARDTVFALRRQIAKIEGTLSERLEAPAGSGSDADRMLVRRSGVAESHGLLATGADHFDAALNGGLPKAALTELHGAETRDAGTVAGFALALACLLLKKTETPAPILWVGTTEIFREAGFPYARGLEAGFGIAPESLLYAEAPKTTDALWIAEEGAGLTALSAVVLELRGNPERLDLTATRRLHRRAQMAGRPVFLLRQAALAEPTAAPVRLLVAPAPATPRNTMAGPLDGTIGRPGIAVTIGKSRATQPGQFTLEWNPDERTFLDRRHAGAIHQRPWDIQKRAKDHVAVVPLSSSGTDPAAASRPVLAFPSPRPSPAGDQPSRPQRPAHRRA
ncbi:ImuA family protein [Mesorhizobium sp. NPDC059054]|uniref:ImuA family protein n=1 Tax=Mesorhizobium sp. NPDC059054 TaxID=3346711 RepID=UPI00369604B2